MACAIVDVDVDVDAWLRAHAHRHSGCWIVPAMPTGSVHPDDQRSWLDAAAAG